MPQTQIKMWNFANPLPYASFSHNLISSQSRTYGNIYLQSLEPSKAYKCIRCNIPNAILIDIEISQRWQVVKCFRVNFCDLIIIEKDWSYLIQPGKCIWRHFFDVIITKIAVMRWNFSYIVLRAFLQVLSGIFLSALHRWNPTQQRYMQKIITFSL
jgi:hypothetical protein